MPLIIKQCDILETLKLRDLGNTVHTLHRGAATSSMLCRHSDVTAHRGQGLDDYRERWPFCKLNLNENPYVCYDT